ncbi:serine hydrolase [Candidatus Gottesmanbacteria bacterium]|nr:serine hydrolase [Candidatus Gottesmanbacteria bacterium]
MTRLPRHVSIVIFSVSILANILMAGYLFFSPRRTLPISKKESQANFQYLAPRIFAENQNDVLINFIELRTKLQTYVTPIPDRIGVFFEYLPSGTSIGINEKQEYLVASLLKVPVAMAAYESIIEGKLKEDTVLTLDKSHLDPYFGALWQEGPGYQLTLSDAIQRMLKQSDNTAARVIFDKLPPGAVENIFDQLDIPKVINESQPVVTPKNYASILKSLYLSSILPKEESQKLLTILTQTDFNDRIVAGIPQGVPVAHKIGFHTYPNLNQSIYTDCGIVYPPSRPFILCIMVQSSEERALLYMKDISRMVYTYVTSYEKNK